MAHRAGEEPAAHGEPHAQVLGNQCGRDFAPRTPRWRSLKNSAGRTGCRILHQWRLPNTGRQGSPRRGAEGRPLRRHRRQQFARVRMLRVFKEFFSWRGLHDFAIVHHRHARGHPAHHAHVVGHQEQRAFFAHQSAHQLQHLRLGDRVKGRRRLVGDEKARVVHHRHRDHHALLHPTRQLMRVGARNPRGIGDAHAFEPVVGDCVELLASGLAVERHGLGDLAADAV